MTVVCSLRAAYMGRFSTNFCRGEVGVKLTKQNSAEKNEDTAVLALLLVFSGHCQQETCAVPPWNFFVSEQSVRYTDGRLSL